MVTTIQASTPPINGQAAPEVRLVTIKVIDAKKEMIEIQAPLANVLHEIKESGGVGMFELQTGQQTPARQVIVQSVDQNEQGIHSLTVKTVRSEDILRVDLELVPKNLPEEVTAHRAQAVRLTRRLKVRGKLRDLPKRIMVDLSALDHHETICASDILLPKGVELLSPKDAALFTIRTIERV